MGKSMGKHKYTILVLIAALVLLAAITYSYLGQGGRPPVMKKVSVIVYGENAQRWENFQQGIMQAALDLNADVTFLTMTDDSSVENQENLLGREVKNGAQGLIVAAVDSQGMKETISLDSKQVAIVMAETNVELEGDLELQYVSANNQKMGEELAESIMGEHDESTPIYLLEVSQHRDSVRERQEGLLSRLSQNGYEVVTWKPEEGVTRLVQFVIKQQSIFPPGVIVSLDDLSFESVIDSIEDKQQNAFSFYGIGSTAKIVYYLDQGIISGIVFQDEYQMGYVSMVRLFEQMTNRKNDSVENNEIEVHATNQNTMHLPENERLLYPIIQ